MCPFNGITQILFIVLILILFNCFVINALKLEFKNDSITVLMDDTISVPYEVIEEQGDVDDKYWLQFKSSNEDIAHIQEEIVLSKHDLPFKSSLNLTGIFLGKTSVSCSNKFKKEPLSGSLDVIVIRKRRLIDRIFTASVATLVTIIYINFGCAINWSELKMHLKRPIGPVIGFCGQFMIMPLLSYGLGRVLFPGNHEMQLGMFFTGVSPAGGASNIWTLILDGNVNLSVTMTTISTIAAFGMMPLWIFTLGKVIFDDAKLGVPYQLIASYAAGLVIPLGIGFLLTRYCKKVAAFLARILKGLSSLLILFIIVFATVTNLYLFKLFSWQIIVAGMGLPYLGFISAYILAKILRQPEPDSLAISIETGIQNTGIAIFLLRFSLTQPAADLTTVCPVAVSVMTPIPLMLLYIYKKIRARIYDPRKQVSSHERIISGPESPSSEESTP